MDADGEGMAVNAVVSIEELMAKLADAEESATRSLRERDQCIKEAEHYKKIAYEANERNPEIQIMRARIDEMRRHQERMAREDMEKRHMLDLECQRLRLELKLANVQIKTLKAQLKAKA